MVYPCRLFARRAMSEAYYTSELLILYSSIIEPLSFGSLLDLLDTISPLVKHTLFLHHDRPNSDHAHVFPTDHELLYFLCADPCHWIDNSNVHGWTDGWFGII